MKTATPARKKTTMPDHFIDALTEKNGGAVDNGPTMPRGVEHRVTKQTGEFGPLVIKRLPAGDWRCDACPTSGHGWLAIKSHFKRTEHRVYTETRPPR